MKCYLIVSSSLTLVSAPFSHIHQKMSILLIASPPSTALDNPSLPSILKMKRKLIFIVILSTVGSSLSVRIESSKFEPVPNTFLDEFYRNSLATVSTQSMRNSKTGCMSVCSATPNCYLACYNGVFCKVSSALVTPYWKPVKSLSQALYPLTGYSCFSSWNFDNDLTAKINKTLVSSTLGTVWDKSYAIDGYYSDSYNTHFVSSYGSTEWFQIDMGLAYAVSEVIVKIRLSPAEPCCSRFTDVEVRVGNSSTTGNFNSNPLLGIFNGAAIQGQFVVFKQATPIIGRYISLQQFESDYFMIAELRVIGY